MVTVVRLSDVVLTVSEKLKVSSPESRSNLKASSCGLVVSIVYWLACKALIPFMSGSIGRSFWSIMPVDSTTSQDVWVDVPICLALISLRSSNVMIMVTMVLAL